MAHACVLLDFDGHKILTDPWLSEKRGYYQGEQRAYATAADVPHLDGVVVSHANYDHFDVEAFASYLDKSVPMASSEASLPRRAVMGSPTSPSSMPESPPSLGQSE
ncbi:MAG: MBL fold metallo-hydrolase [Lapillicoccus sp.]